MENLPPEIILNIFKYLNEIDIFNCSVALLGTRNGEFVTQTYLKPQLKIYACLDLDLKKSLYILEPKSILVTLVSFISKLYLLRYKA